MTTIEIRKQANEAEHIVYTSILTEVLRELSTFPGMAVDFTVWERDKAIGNYRYGHFTDNGTCTYKGHTVQLGIRRSHYVVTLIAYVWLQKEIGTFETYKRVKSTVSVEDLYKKIVNAYTKSKNDFE